MSSDFDVVVVGHLTVDVNVFPEGQTPGVMGGSPSYSGKGLAKLGRKVGIVSRVEDGLRDRLRSFFPEDNPDRTGILSTSDRGTYFKNIYDEKGKRSQICRSVADPISAGDVPEIYRDSRSFYISPVFHEMSPDVVELLSDVENTVMLDPQGIFREIGEEDEVEVGIPEDLEDYLKHANIVKVGSEELEVFDGECDEVLEMLVDMGPSVAIVTRGEEGCSVLADGVISDFGSLDVEVEDPTGAGDTFGAGFLSSYLDNGDPIESARFGTVFAGLTLRKKGPEGFPEADRVEKELIAMKGED